MALCSESTGTIWPGRARSFTSGPPMMSDSLLASASVVPASRAARVGRRPTAPVMPLRTTSQGRPAASVEASSPSPEYAGANSATWASNSSGLDPPAVRPTTRNRSGWARTRSSAWVPMDPVEPRITMSRAVTAPVCQDDARGPAPAPGSVLRRVERPEPQAADLDERGPGRHRQLVVVRRAEGVEDRERVGAVA